MHEFGMDLMSPAAWLPLVFALVMALSMLAYVILDGYDLGEGVLLDSADSVEQKDIMIASIGPFWNANEIWLVLGVGVVLVGFPMAHGVILGALYLPVALMLVALSLRGVAFDFRVKVKAHHRRCETKPFTKVLYLLHGRKVLCWASSSLGSSKTQRLMSSAP
jgi:cytochrome d ubiquinol oxidase subunit II